MAIFITLLLFAIWLICAIYMPTMLCGLNWAELIALKFSNSNSTEILEYATKFLKAIGLTNTTYQEQITKYFVLSIVLTILLLIIVILLSKSINKHFFRNDANKQQTQIEEELKPRILTKEEIEKIKEKQQKQKIKDEINKKFLPFYWIGLTSAIMVFISQFFTTICENLSTSLFIEGIIIFLIYCAVTIPMKRKLFQQEINKIKNNQVKAKPEDDL